MTYREKLALEHPDFVDETFVGGCSGCPTTYGYTDDHGCPDIPSNKSCRDCWDREIPETEEIKKENDIMPTHTINVNTKMTKAELVEEIKLAHEHIQAMETQIKNLEKYKQYEEAADELKALHTAFMNSGFTNEQAFDLLKTMTQSMIPAALRGMRV